jgi:sugar (pentulose or hexulose) kinase
MGVKRPSCVGVDTWGVDFALLGKDGQLLGLPLCYRDGVSEGMEKVTALVIGADRLYRLTGLPPSRVTTLSQLVGLRRSPSRGRLRQADTLLMMADLFRYFLCGRKGIERTEAGSSQLADVSTGRWSAAVFRESGLPLRIMPRMIAPGALAGEITREVQTLTGLGPTPVAVVAGHDTASAAAAAPYADEHTAFLSLGTWASVGVELQRAVTTPEARRRGFVNEFGLDSVLFVRNLSGMYLVEALRRQLHRQGKPVSYSQMIRAAAAAKPFRHFLDVNDASFFLVDDPVAQANQYLARTGQRPLRQWPELMRALLEGQAFSFRRALADLQATTGRRLRRLCLIGGGSRNRLLCRMVADATELVVIAGPPEATAAGNVAIQALAVGVMKDPAHIRALVRKSFPPVVYTPRDARGWKRGLGSGAR